jgi:topoisomerase IA-like protein
MDALERAVKKGKDNYKIPKDKKAETLTEAEVLEIVSAGPSKKQSPAKDLPRRNR